MDSVNIIFAEPGDARRALIWFPGDVDASRATQVGGTNNVLASLHGIILPDGNVWNKTVDILNAPLSIPMKRAICSFANVSAFLHIGFIGNFVHIMDKTEVAVVRDGKPFPVLFTTGYNGIDERIQDLSSGVQQPPERDLCAAQAVAKYDRKLTVQSEHYNDIVAVVATRSNQTLWGEDRPIITEEVLKDVERMNLMYNALGANLRCFQRMETYAVNLQFNDPMYRTFYNVAVGKSPNVELVHREGNIFEVKTTKALVAGESLQRSYVDAFPTTPPTTLPGEQMMTQLEATRVTEVTSCKTTALMESWRATHPGALVYAARLKMPQTPNYTCTWKWFTQYADNKKYHGKWAVTAGDKAWSEKEFQEAMNVLESTEAQQGTSGADLKTLVESIDERITKFCETFSLNIKTAI